MSILQSRLIEVKKEKAGAIEEAEDQEETTKQVTLMLDLWQSYADELKRQVKQLGGHPISWDEFRREQHGMNSTNSTGKCTSAAS